MAITGMNLANTNSAEHEVMISDLHEKISDLEARIAVLTSAAVTTPATEGEQSGAG